MSLDGYVSQLAFEPDDFQRRAFEILERNESVVVSAPTGAGKTLIAEAPFSDPVVYLRVTGDYMAYAFSYSADGLTWQTLADGVDGSSLSPAVLGGFNYTGVYLGLYASSNGEPTQNFADFEFFRYQPTAQTRDDWYYRQSGRVSPE